MTKIPKQAKKVFQGKVFSIYQWPQKMFDGSISTFELAQKYSGVCVIATIGNKIVIVKQKQPGTSWYYSLPGGYMDIEGESSKSAAIRELREETGLKPKYIRLWKKFPFGGRVVGDLYVYIAQNCKQVYEKSPDSGEIIKTKLISFKDFLKLPDNPSFHNSRLIIELLKARLDKSHLEELKTVIFG